MTARRRNWKTELKDKTGAWKGIEFFSVYVARGAEVLKPDDTLVRWGIIPEMRCKHFNRNFPQRKVFRSAF